MSTQSEEKKKGLGFVAGWDEGRDGHWMKLWKNMLTIPLLILQIGTLRASCY